MRGKEVGRAGEDLSDGGRGEVAKRHRWVQMNVFVPAELRRALKVRAAEEGRDMSDISAELIRAYLGREEEAGPVVWRTRGRG